MLNQVLHSSSSPIERLLLKAWRFQVQYIKLFGVSRTLQVHFLMFFFFFSVSLIWYVWNIFFILFFGQNSSMAFINCYINWWTIECVILLYKMKNNNNIFLVFFLSKTWVLLDYQADTLSCIFRTIVLLLFECIIIWSH